MSKKEITIGIDIGGTNSVFGAVDREGNIIAADAISTRDYEEVGEFVNAISERIKTLLKHYKNEYILKGIGIGAPNANYYTGNIEFAPNLKWKEKIPLRDMIKAHFDAPVMITNDANAAAIGEMIYGGAKGMKDFVVVTLGTGVGSGFVVNGKLVYGHDGFAGELGHTIVFPEGRECGCGRKGCLETYSSASGIVRTVIEMLGNSNAESELRKIPVGNITSKIIAGAAERGDAIALEAFDFTAKILGLKLADTVAITSPEAIFLFGGLAQSGKLIFEPVKYYMEYYMLNIYKNKVKLLPSQLEGPNAAILGASALVWE